MVDGLKNVSEEEIKQAIKGAAPDCLPPLKSYEIISIVGVLKGPSRSKNIFNDVSHQPLFLIDKIRLYIVNYHIL